MNKKKPLEKMFPMIDSIYWDLVESNCYTEIPDTTGTIETVKENEKALLQALKEKNVSDDVIEKVALDLNEVKNCAELFGEEKGFILGFIHGAKMFSDISEASELFQLFPAVTRGIQDE